MEKFCNFGAVGFLLLVIALKPITIFIFFILHSLISLGRPPSNTYKGDPFVPRIVVPVDLFPHTRHVEVVILYERLPLSEMANTAAKSRD